jgi:hypothetical protein
MNILMWLMLGFMMCLLGRHLLNLAKTLIVRLEGIRIEIKLAPGASPPHIVPQETALGVPTPEQVHVLTKGS